jgi:hypothetical protein
VKAIILPTLGIVAVLTLVCAQTAKADQQAYNIGGQAARDDWRNGALGAWSFH